ncbi:hypothetical protein [Sulfurimonas sp. HSL3-7]|uniref:hypothetical protein n=1 Tax=Sulfonitrofixus jiaomeiensis TaxID=3131938 RepID=UPI0031F935E5
MLYIVTALSAEARPIIDHFRLKKVENALPYPLFSAENVRLLVMQVGYENALMAASSLFGHERPKEDDLLLNVGICAAPTRYTLGTPLVAHKITHKEHAYYPDMLLNHPFEEVELHTLEGAKDSEHAHPVDMEAHAVFKAASRFMQSHQMLFVKVVSDHFEPERVTKEAATTLIAAQLKGILHLADELSHLVRKPSLFNEEELERIEALKTLFSKTQGHVFEDACYYYKLKNGSALPPSIQNVEEKLTKLERNRLHERCITALTV